MKKTHLLLYNTNPGEAGSYIKGRFRSRASAEKALMSLRRMRPASRARVFGCSEKAAARMRLHVATIVLWRDWKPVS